MGKHLTLSQLQAYLDGSLSPSDRRQIWQHVHQCSACWGKLMQEEALHRHLAGIVPQRRVNVAALLPKILREARRPARLSLNRRGVGWIILIIVMSLLPLYPDFGEVDATPFQPLMNIPAVTPTNQPAKPQTSVTRMPMKVRVSVLDAPSNLPKGFNIEYASPVPPPRATAVASVPPGGRR